MKRRVPGQEIDQAKLGERLWKDSQVRGLNREDAMDHIRWKKQIRSIDDHEQVNVSSGAGSLGLSQTKSIEP